jgi:putative membrane protein insertion efficiency factor
MLKIFLKTLVVWLIQGYRYIVSPFLGPCCRFTPSCSEYALIAIEKHGITKGLWYAGRRILRCHPWQVGGEDECL